jgi:hypothetical protein
VIPEPPKKTASKKPEVISQYEDAYHDRNRRILQLVKGRTARIILTDDEWDGVRRVRDNVWSKDTKARELIEQMTGAEVAYVADDPETWLRCKVKVDLEALHARVMCDLKTSRTVTPEGWSRPTAPLRSIST